VASNQYRVFQVSKDIQIVITSDRMKWPGFRRKSNCRIGLIASGTNCRHPVSDYPDPAIEAKDIEWGS